MIDSPEDYCCRHHVCRGIWGGVRHPLFFWLVWQHIPGGPLHASSPASAVLARPWRCDLGKVTAGCCSHLPLVPGRVACPLDCPRHPHRRVRQARGGRRHSRRVLPSDRPDTKRGQLALPASATVCPPRHHVQEGANGKDRSMTGTGRPGCGSRRLIGLRPALRDSVLIPAR